MAYLPESPRWLLLSGAGPEAAAGALRRAKGRVASEAAVQVRAFSACSCWQHCILDMPASGLQIPTLLVRSDNQIQAEVEEIQEAMAASPMASQGAFGAPANGACCFWIRGVLHAACSALGLEHCHLNP